MPRFEAHITVEYDAEDKEDALWVLDEEIIGRLDTIVVHSEVNPLFDEEEVYG